MTLEEIKKELNYKNQSTCTICKHRVRMKFGVNERVGCEVISKKLGKPFGSTNKSVCDAFEKR